MPFIQPITREIQFDYGHRVPKHDSKCKNLHGHRGTIIIEITGELYKDGPQTDMVMDYGLLKDLLMEHVDAMIDHAMILSLHDTKFVDMAYDEKLTSKKSHIFVDWVNEVAKSVRLRSFWAGQTAFGKTYIINDSPTAEVLAQHFFNILSPYVLQRTNKQAKLTCITFKETPNTSASYRLQE